ncbi:MAG TPA: COX15/CtaA family protein, partial [Gemmatimonadaceae bacterium]|nr:COX15/CtaA family protein [Gemmatimonadaceae bacterium]
VAFVHLVFGALVRITGSGMGCGDHWPRCHGQWFPPLDRPDLIIEITHRWLAAFLGAWVLALFLAAVARRREAGVAGPGGVLRSSAAALAAVVAAGGFGAVTVRYGNPTWATVVHWSIAMIVVATLVATVMRAGGFGASLAVPGTASARTVRGATIAAALALAAVVLGGLTAKVPDGAVACLAFPHCGTNPDAAAGAVHTQLTHRIIAFLLFFHYVGLVMALRRRRESPVVTRAAWLGFAVVLAQLLVAGAMIGMKLPTALRSLHEAVGVLVWLTSFALVSLARRAARQAAAVSAPAGAPWDAERRAAGVAR